MCSYANDQDFRFCQDRSYKRKVNTTESVRRIAGDLEKIDQRLQQLMNFDQETIILAVDILGKRESMTVDVQCVCHTRH